MNISERALGQYPISIASSLALESATGIHPDIKVAKPPLLEYNEFWVNLRTLYRNMVGACDKDTQGSLTPGILKRTLLEEMEMIEGIVAEGAGRRIKVIFYYSNYKNIEGRYKHGVVRMDNTPAQKEHRALSNNTFKILFEEQDKEKTHDIKLFDILIKTEQKVNALLLTNYPIDLLCHKEFLQLDLLESHTGKIKGKNQWYTKFYQGENLSNIPLTSYFMRVFGDKETWRPMAIQIRKDIIDVAKKYNWSSVSTRDKIMYGIDSLKNPYFKEIMKEMMANE